jgi:hypothetical protein
MYTIEEISKESYSCSSNRSLAISHEQYEQ